MPLWQSAPLWLVLNAAALAVGLLPRRLELALGRALGRLALRVDPKRRRIAEENLSRCLPDRPPEARRRLLEANYEHYGVLALELLHMFSPLPGHYRRYARRIAVLEGFEHWKRASDKGKGLIFASCHLGNWEMMVAMGALHGIPLTMVTRHLKPEWLHRRVERARLSVAVKAAYQPRTLPTLMRALRNGESVGFVIDQYAPPPMGVPARFFGATVDTLGAVGPLAQRTGAAVVPVSTRRDEDGIVHVVIEPELDLGEALADQRRSTQALADRVEAWIRACPEQWLWVHRRFKNAAWS